MSINERIIEVRKTVGLNQTRFGERINISSSSISKLEKGVNNPSAQTISLICHEFGISRKWLVTGEGTMMGERRNSDSEFLTRAVEHEISEKKQLIRIVAAIPAGDLITLNARIKAIRKAAKLTQEEFGARIGIKQNSVALIESGKRNPSSKLILSICREFGINRTWLETGEGDKIDDRIWQHIDILPHASCRENNAKKLVILIAIAMPDDLLESMVSYLKSAIKEPEA